MTSDMEAPVYCLDSQIAFLLYSLTAKTTTEPCTALIQDCLKLIHKISLPNICSDGLYSQYFSRPFPLSVPFTAHPSKEPSGSSVA